MEKTRSRIFNLSPFILVILSTLSLIAIKIVFLFIFKKLSINLDVVSSKYTRYINLNFSDTFCTYCVRIPLCIAYLIQRLCIRVPMGWLEFIFEERHPVLYIIPITFSAAMYTLLISAFYKTSSDIGQILVLLQYFLMGLILGWAYMIPYERRENAFMCVLAINVLVHAFSIIFYYVRFF